MDTTSILNAASDTLTGQLTSEQLLALKMRALELSLSTQVNMEDILVPIVLPAIFFLSIAAITILYFYFSYKTKKRRLD